MPDHDKQTMIAAKRIAAGMVADLYAADKARRKMRLEQDKKSRLTVGTKMPRWEAEIYRSAARETGRSLNRFVRDAIREEYTRCKGRPPW